jgi:serine/threonine protein kinase
MAYADVPEPVRAWVERSLGAPVVAAADQVGGMSPGCATRLVCADGTRAFVKAVGPELNPDTPAMFRREALTLGLLGRHPLWAPLLEVYDEPGGWVALLLEDVEGRHPHVHDDAEMTGLTRATDALVEATAGRVTTLPDPDGEIALLDVSSTVRRWAEALAHARSVSPELMPRWVADRADELHERAVALAARAEAEAGALVHWDIRNDNLLVRPDGSFVFVDWGAASRGPRWADPLVVRLERVEDPWFDVSVRDSPELARLGDEHVTTFLVALAGFLAYRAETAVDVGLPTLNAFRRTESARFFGGAARRLGV